MADLRNKKQPEDISHKSDRRIAHHGDRHAKQKQRLEPESAREPGHLPENDDFGDDAGRPQPAHRALGDTVLFNVDRVKTLQHAVRGAHQKT